VGRAPPNDLSGRHLQRGEEIHRAMPPAITRPSFGVACTPIAIGYQTRRTALMEGRVREPVRTL
jgi:hypothetical protein